jgi:hypothetical protein
MKTKHCECRAIGRTDLRSFGRELKVIIWLPTKATTKDEAYRD